MDEGWEDGKMSHWEIENQHFMLPKNLSFAETRLNRDLSLQPNYIDESELNANDYHFIELATENNVRYLNRLPLNTFRKLLANHFDIRFKKRSLKWPRRVRNKPKL